MVRKYSLFAVEAVKKMADAVQSVSDKVPIMVEWFREHEAIIKAVTIAVLAGATAFGTFKLVMNFGTILDTLKNGLIAVKTAVLAANAAMAANPIVLIVEFDCRISSCNYYVMEH